MDRSSIETRSTSAKAGTLSPALRRLSARFHFGGVAQAMPRGTVAKVVAGQLAVARTQHIAQIGFVFERVGMLLVVTANANRLGRFRDDGEGRFFAAFLDVDGAGSVAGFALDVLQSSRVPEAAATDFTVAGDVAAYAILVGFFADIDQRFPRLGMDGVLP